MNIVFVGDEIRELQPMIERLHHKMYCSAHLLSSIDAFKKAFDREQYNIDVIVVEMNFRPDDRQGGLRIIEYVQQRQFEYIPIIVMTVYEDFDNAIRALDMGAFHYIFKGGDTEATVKILAGMIKRAYDLRLERLQADGFALAISNLIDTYDHWLHGHSRRVGRYAQLLALKIQLPANEVQIAKRAGMVHDIAKIHLDCQAFQVKGSLSDILKDTMKEHPVRGYELLKELGNPPALLLAVLEHHLRIDGSGYPLEHPALQAELSTIGQIIGLVDSFDAMTTPRSYRESTLTILAALDQLELDARKGCYARSLVAAWRACLPDIYYTIENDYKRGVLPEIMWRANLSTEGEPLTEPSATR